MSEVLALLALLAFPVAVMLLGSLLAMTGWAIGSQLPVIADVLQDASYPRVVNRSLLLAAILASWTICKIAKCKRADVIGDAGFRNWKRSVLVGFAVGVISILALLISHVACGISVWDDQRSVGEYGAILMKAVIAGTSVALLEETVFRGAFYGAMKKRFSAASCSIGVAIVFAAVHFIRFENMADGAFPMAHLATPPWILSIRTTGVLVNIILVGFLLNLLKDHFRSIVVGCGLHAGWVAGIRVMRRLVDYEPQPDRGWLADPSFDGVSGWLGAFLSFVLLAIVVMIRRLQNDRSANTRALQSTETE